MTDAFGATQGHKGELMAGGTSLADPPAALQSDMEARHLQMSAGGTAGRKVARAPGLEDFENSLGSPRPLPSPVQGPCRLVGVSSNATSHLPGWKSHPQRNTGSFKLGEKT